MAFLLVFRTSFYAEARNPTGAQRVRGAAWQRLFLVDLGILFSLFGAFFTPLPPLRLNVVLDVSF